MEELKAAGKRKRTQPLKIPTGAKPKKKKTSRKSEPEHLYGGSITSIFPTEEDRFKKFPEVKYEGFQPDEGHDPKLVEMAKQQPDLMSLKHDPSSENTEVIEEVLDEGTVLTPEEQEQRSAVEALLNEMRYMDQSTQTDPVEPTFLPVGPPYLRCPVHDVSIEEFVSKKGWEYIKCPYTDCFLFASKSDLIPYMKAVHTQLYPEMKLKWKHLLCFCAQPVTLRISRSQQNPERIFLGCNVRKCNFFQWADIPLTSKNREWVEGKASNRSVDPYTDPIKEYAGKTLLRDHTHQPSQDDTKILQSLLAGIQQELQFLTPEERTHYLNEIKIPLPKSPLPNTFHVPKYFDDSGNGTYKGETISVTDNTNEIVHPPELKGLIYRKAPKPKGYYVSGPYFFDDGNYPSPIWMADDGKNTIGSPPELKGLLYRQTPEKAKKSKEKLNKWREEEERRNELKRLNKELL